MQVTFEHFTDTAANIKTFYFKPERSVRYEAGQFIELTIPHDNADKRGQKRWFTLSSSPTEELLSITTKFALENGSTFKQALLALQPGTSLRMADPMGDFVLPKDQSKPLIFVAGGIGVTPMHSMVQFLHDNKEARDITLIYAANKEDEVAFSDLFKGYDLNFIPVIREAQASWSGETGTLDPERITKFAPKITESTVYLSGPEPMVEALFDGLKKAGVDKRNIVTDYFPGYTQI